MDQRNLVGDTILGYEVVAQIGSGAFGTVYKAVKSNALGEYVRALKHISLPTRRQYNSVLNSMGGDAEKADGYFAEMLNGIASEITLLSGLSEKRAAHIVRYYESDLETQESPLRYDVYMLMEYATPLLDHIEQRGGFTVRDVLDVGLDSLEGIRVCHENGVIHRDIKEDNIFVSSLGDYEIGDFGVSKVLKDSSRAESLKGTPNYLAPEVYLNKGGYTKSVDLYAMGIVLYRLLNHGRNPFMPPFPERYLAEDEDAAFERRMRGLAAPAPALGSEQIHHVILKAISTEAERYKDAYSFISDLEEALEETAPEILDEQIGYTSADMAGEDATSDKSTPSQGTIRVGIGSLHSDSVARSGSMDEDQDYWVETNEQPDFDATHDEEAEQHQGTSPEADDCGEARLSTLEDTVSYHKDNGQTHKSYDRTTNENDLAAKRKAQDKTSILVLAGVFAVSAIVALATMSDGQAISGLSAACAFASLIGLLFFVGHSIHGRGDVSPSAIMVDREPQMLVSDAKFSISSIARDSNDPDVRLCLKDLDLLEERLAAEPKFGYGNGQTTICENDIAGRLEHISSIASTATRQGGRVKELRELIHEANHLLDKRRMLLRR